MNGLDEDWDQEILDSLGSSVEEKVEAESNIKVHTDILRKVGEYGDIFIQNYTE